jgi:hypothetical protein
MVNAIASSVSISGLIPYSQTSTGSSATPPSPGDAMTPATDLRVSTVSIRGPQQAVWVDINTKTSDVADGGFLSEDGKGNLVAGQASLTNTPTGEAFALELLGVSVDNSNSASGPNGGPSSPLATTPAKAAQPGDNVNIVA